MGAICNSDKKSKPRVITATNLQDLSRKPSNVSQLNLILEKKDKFQDHYNINEIIHSTPYLKIYIVIHKETNEAREMRIIKKKYYHSTQNDIKNLINELEILVKMEHPNILKYYEYYYDSEYYYLVSEIYKGDNMYQMIANLDNFTEFDAGIIMEQLFSALFYMHSKGIIHKELRPENILLEKDENDNMNIKLSKFGLTGFLDRNAKIFKCREIDYFTAPEYLDNNYNYKLDIWSCGVILYTLFVGTPPFEGKNLTELKENIKTGKVNFEIKEWNDISKEAKNLITSLLRIDAVKRLSAEEAWSGTWIKKFTKNKKNQNLNKVKINTEKFKTFSSKQLFLVDFYNFILNQFSSRESKKELTDIFISLDKNKSGKLNFLEIKEVYKKYYGEEIAERELGEFIKDNTFDNDKYLIYEEFLLNINSTNHIFFNKKLKISFDSLDLQETGKVPLEEIKNLIKLELNEGKIENSFLQGIITEIENLSNQTISFEDLKELVIKHVIR